MLSLLEASSPIIAPASWIVLISATVWRRRFARDSLGLDRETFKLMMGMKGSQNRERILNRLSSPKDRFQLANDLGMDWKTADYHISLLLKHALIHESTAYGKVKLYELTANGRMVLKALDNLNSNSTCKNEASFGSIQDAGATSSLDN
jgi:hypothetical protein